TVSENRPLSLSDVSATMLLTLYARALETLSPDPILVDEKAVALRERLNPLLDPAADELSRKLAQGDLPPALLQTMSLRARHFDRQAEAFLGRRPDGAIVNLGCGLDTRFDRIDDGRLQFYDLDLPDVIALKRQLVAETDRYQFIASSVLDFAWMDRLAGQRPYLFLAEGLFMYLPLADVRALVLALQARFPGSELLCEVFNANWLQGWRQRVVQNKLQNSMAMGAGAMFQSGLRASDEMEQWGEGLQFLDDWTYFDENEPKLGAIRLLRRWDALRKIQWVVHYRLN
ncbi:MAG: class I SAM-dependent methyltransferase, partial [Anaerolineales bacterium]|nr:class I SAM-dependent methyltransferase [Anaerolineales bacterium]